LSLEALSKAVSMDFRAVLDDESFRVTIHIGGSGVDADVAAERQVELHAYADAAVMALLG
jgi:hypothetical protein